MSEQRVKDDAWSWYLMWAVCCFAGGIGSVLVGSVLTASTWILGAEAHPLVHGLGTALLILTIPLLILAGYCMDWAEREPNKTRRPNAEHGERGSVPLYQNLVGVFFFIVTLAAPLELHAQQTVFNVPTTDVLPAGKVYFELDVSAKPNEPKFSSFVPRVIQKTEEKVIHNVKRQNEFSFVRIRGVAMLSRDSAILPSES